jgi:hypothetical protein
MAHEIDRKPRGAAARWKEEMVSRAVKRTEWAGSALEGAAGDLTDLAENGNADALGRLAELVQDEADRVSRLAEDIASQLSEADAAQAGDG